MVDSKFIEIDLHGKTIKIETGKMAKQADGAVVVTCGETTVLATAVSSDKPREGIDFFPLLVNYEEKFYAAGKIPGGFFKREGKPSNNAVLTSRLIDRPLRPLFPKDYKNDVQIIITTLSYDEKNMPDVLALIGASAALWISDIPFKCPIGAVRMGMKDDQFIVNPTVEEMEESKLDLIVAGPKDSVVMMEGGANELPEEKILEAIEIAQKSINTLITGQEKLLDILKKTRKEYIPDNENDEKKDKLYNDVNAKFGQDIKNIICIADKKERENALNALFDKVVNKFAIEDEEISIFKDIFDEIYHEMFRKLILLDKKRSDGRKLDEIRPITCEVGLIPRVHGSALFTRGQTQALAITTLGSVKDRQFIDTLQEESSERFYLHYNFPPFSVGDVRPRRGQSRREIGHGSLAEKALKALIPSEEEFPYTIRMVSEILESNGSSSMATVCSGSLSLMDAGVLMKRPIAGIAMGLIKEKDNVEILTDILGLEDHYGDMDFKSAGSSKGITAIQMDLKIDGISKDILSDILFKAKKARLSILEIMNKVISEPKKDLSEHAPKITILKIDSNKIGSVIGPGGKNIKKIIELTGASVDIKEDGEVFISSIDKEAVKNAIKMVEDIVKEAKVGEIYKGRVTRTTNFGAFVEILPGKEGLVHISKLAHRRIEHVEDVVKTNDNIVVKVIKIDNQGRIDLRKVEDDQENSDNNGIYSNNEKYD
ncbi:MAG: polyribonucleotide nucleotidyltransferase [Candidatus Caldatribacteriota bacterium]|nr:polyribonucleotide nucleotidyltransferase [Candidatus Caldatribacteriota bacterium]